MPIPACAGPKYLKAEILPPVTYPERALETPRLEWSVTFSVLAAGASSPRQVRLALGLAGWR